MSSRQRYDFSRYDERQVVEGRSRAGWVGPLAVFVTCLVGVAWLSGYLQGYAVDAQAAAEVNLGTWAIGVPLSIIVALCSRPSGRRR